MNTDPTPSVERDARNRAFRTFVQGFGLDVAAGAVTALGVGIAGGIEWTRLYWVALGLAVAKSVIQAGVSYLARKFVPPAGTGAA